MERFYFVWRQYLLFYLGVMTYKGYDKITNYYNSDYSMLNKNAYVGGDAYNYIINGTYAAAYFVLAAGFLISGIVCMAAGFLLIVIDENNKKIRMEGSSEPQEELPPL